MKEPTKELRPAELKAKPRRTLKSIRFGAYLRDCLPMLTGAFVLSGSEIFGQPLPLGACLICAMPLSPSTVAAAVGSIFGSLLRIEGIGGLQFASVSLLALAAAALFHGTALPATRWFMPAIVGLVCSVLGLVCTQPTDAAGGLFILGGSLLAGLSTAIFRRALNGNRRCGLYLAAALLSGLSTFGFSFDLGILCAGAMCGISGDLLSAAACGIVLDLTQMRYVTIAVILPAIFTRTLGRRDRILTPLTYLLLPNLVFLAFGTATLPLCISWSLGYSLGYTARFLGLQPKGLEEEGKESALRYLDNAARVLDLIQAQIPVADLSPLQMETDSIYDNTAQKICRCCPRFTHCWQYRAEETYEAFCKAAPLFMDRGIAMPEDFPKDFRDHCCYMDGFLTALNQELEGMLYRRRYRIQLRECRQVFSEELNCIARYLRTTGTGECFPVIRECTFRPVIGVSSIAKNGNRKIGDRGVSFPGPNTDFFILLCDGMGTGAEAHRLSGRTVRLLEQLLRSGLQPEDALKILNGMELLSGVGTFTTVDLLHLDLCEGNAVLYKWGAAPSYRKTDDGVEVIGTAAPPPGVGVGGTHRPERYELSLKRGGMLVLVSDGADGEETEHTVAAYTGSSPRELAALLIAETSAEDDRTAVVVSLRLREA